MKPKAGLLIALLLLALIGGVARPAKPRAAIESTAAETRCGWFSNPTPANISLYDRDGEWIIGVQGGYQVPGDWPWPDFKKGQWVKTNGEHGYGCACLTLRVNKQTREVLEISSARPRPLAQCRKDAVLKKWSRVL